MGELPATGRRLITFDDGEQASLYVTGEFTHAGGVEVNYIARWDGQAWHDLDGGLNDAGHAVTIYDEGEGPAVIVGGTFSTTGDVSSMKIGKWRLCPAGTACPGDLDGSGTVDVSDLLALLGQWGTCPDPPAECPADLDADGEVGVLDLLVLLGGWGPCR